MKTTGIITFGLALTIGIACWFYGCSNVAQTKPTGITAKTDSASGNISDEDRKFMLSAAQINLLEIKAGKLAQKVAASDDIKQMGKMLEDDHTKSWHELTELAKKKSVTLPNALDSDSQKNYDKLASKKGNDFDKTFTNAMIDGHKDAIKLFEKESAQSKDDDLKKWASETLPTLHKHLDEANKCKEKMKSMSVN